MVDSWENPWPVIVSTAIKCPKPVRRQFALYVTQLSFCLSFPWLPPPPLSHEIYMQILKPRTSEKTQAVALWPHPMGRTHQKVAIWEGCILYILLVYCICILWGLAESEPLAWAWASSNICFTLFLGTGHWTRALCMLGSASELHSEPRLQASFCSVGMQKIQGTWVLILALIAHVAFWS